MNRKKKYTYIYIYDSRQNTSSENRCGKKSIFIFGCYCHGRADFMRNVLQAMTALMIDWVYSFGVGDELSPQLDLLPHEVQPHECRDTPHWLYPESNSVDTSGGWPTIGTRPTGPVQFFIARDAARPADHVVFLFDDDDDE